MITACAFVLALLCGTLVEYLAHRGMHEWGFFAKAHWEHHRANHVDRWVRRLFLLYLPAISPLLALGLLGGWAFFLGWAAGGVSYCVTFSACHVVQHRHPSKVFWMRAPVHHLHHRHFRGRCNYGVVVDWWDRVFGTYRLPNTPRPPGAP
jgi:sterol desaturase/sphingolipid hydroxylase (fatty acid hydroxylase superfamily)